MPDSGARKTAFRIVVYSLRHHQCMIACRQSSTCQQMLRVRKKQQEYIQAGRVGSRNSVAGCRAAVNITADLLEMLTSV